MILISDIYVSITVSLLHMIYIYIHWVGGNSQYSMLDRPYYNNMLFDNYKREIFRTFMI